MTYDDEVKGNYICVVLHFLYYFEPLRNFFLNETLDRFSENILLKEIKVIS